MDETGPFSFIDGNSIAARWRAKEKKGKREKEREGAGGMERERENRRASRSTLGGYLAGVERRIPYHRLRFLNQSVLTWPRSIDALSLSCSFVLSLAGYTGYTTKDTLLLVKQLRSRTERDAHAFSHGECYLILLKMIFDYWKVQRKNSRLKSDKRNNRYFGRIFSQHSRRRDSSVKSAVTRNTAAT